MRQRPDLFFFFPFFRVDPDRFCPPFFPPPLGRFGFSGRKESTTNFPLLFHVAAKDSCGIRDDAVHFPPPLFGCSVYPILSFFFPPSSDSFDFQKASFYDDLLFFSPLKFPVGHSGLHRFSRLGPPLPFSPFFHGARALPPPFFPSQTTARKHFHKAHRGCFFSLFSLPPLSLFRTLTFFFFLFFNVGLHSLRRYYDGGLFILRACKKRAF